LHFRTKNQEPTIPIAVSALKPTFPAMSSPSPFSERKDKAQIEESTDFSPKFDENGLIPAMAIDATTKEPLMLAYMNELSLKLTLEYGEAVYWSRSRSEIWHKGKTSAWSIKSVLVPATLAVVPVFTEKSSQVPPLPSNLPRPTSPSIRVRYIRNHDPGRDQRN